ncbi:MAG: hypothetical protein ACI96M_000387 [Candidatus Azotimanducaceae bacterium]|jgi:hypothetical protein
MKMKSKDNTDHPESIAKIATEILADIKNLGLGEFAFSRARTHCSDLEKDAQKYEENYRQLLPGALDSGNDQAEAYADRLRCSREWASFYAEEPTETDDRTGDLFEWAGVNVEQAASQQQTTAITDNVAE